MLAALRDGRQSHQSSTVEDCTMSGAIGGNGSDPRRYFARDVTRTVVPSISAPSAPMTLDGCASIFAV